MAPRDPAHLGHLRFWGLTDRGPLRGGPRRGGTDVGSLPTSGHSSGALSTAWGLLSHHPLYLRSLPITGHHTAVMYL